MNKRRIKKYLIICLVLLECITLSLTYKSFNNRETSSSIEENKVDKKKFSMYIENDTGKYEEYTTSENFPVGYILNLDKSSCTDTKGNLITNVLSSNGNYITVTSNKTMYCYLYFDAAKDDLTINIITDGTENTLPTSGGYKGVVSCSNATATFSDKYQGIIVNLTTRNATCDLTYTKNTTTYTKLSTKVQNSGTTISSTDNVGNTDISYRYTGKNPNNYVWFNNELWRIIGLIPTCTSSGCATEENLVKIIRNDSIGGLVYDASSTTYTELQGAWGSNTLYKLLNQYYYGKKDGTNSGYCYGYYTSTYKPIVGCDYTKIGISNLNTDYYGRMTKNVYWNTGASTNGAAAAVYKTETATQTVSGYIGLMAASDFGYAASPTYHSTIMNSFSSAVATDWLYGEGYDWTSIQNSGYSYFALSVDSNGYLEHYSAYPGHAARPVVYLDSSVYIISGEGTEDNPYILGM